MWIFLIIFIICLIVFIKFRFFNSNKHAKHMNRPINNISNFFSSNKHAKHMARNSNLGQYINNFKIDSGFLLGSVIFNLFSIRDYWIRNRQQITIKKISLRDSRLFQSMGHYIFHLTNLGEETFTFGIILFFVGYILHHILKDNSFTSYSLLSLTIMTLIIILILMIIPKVPVIISSIKSFIFTILFCILFIVAICILLMFGLI